MARARNVIDVRGEASYFRDWIEGYFAGFSFEGDKITPDIIRLWLQKGAQDALLAATYIRQLAYQTVEDNDIVTGPDLEAFFQESDHHKLQTLLRTDHWFLPAFLRAYNAVEHTLNLRARPAGGQHARLDHSLVLRTLPALFQNTPNGLPAIVPERFFHVIYSAQNIVADPSVSPLTRYDVREINENIEIARRLRTISRTQGREYIDYGRLDDAAFNRNELWHESLAADVRPNIVWTGPPTGIDVLLEGLDE